MPFVLVAGCTPPTVRFDVTGVPGPMLLNESAGVAGPAPVPVGRYQADVIDFFTPGVYGPYAVMGPSRTKRNSAEAKALTALDGQPNRAVTGLRFTVFGNAIGGGH